MTQIKIEVPSNDPIALSALGEALQRIAAERKGEQPYKRDIDAILNAINDKVEAAENDSVLKAVRELQPVPQASADFSQPVKFENTTTEEQHNENMLADQVNQLHEQVDASGDVKVPDVLPTDDTTEQVDASIVLSTDTETVGEVTGLADVDNTLDKDGLPWDKRIHSRGKTRLADDTWRLARKPNDKTQEEWDEYVASVKAELKAVQDIPVPSDTVTIATDVNNVEYQQTQGVISPDCKVEVTLDEQAPTETLTPPVVETETVTPPTLDEQAVADVQASEPVAAVEPPTSVTAPVADDTPTKMKLASIDSKPVEGEPTITALNAPPVNGKPYGEVIKSGSEFQSLMVYLTQDARHRGATNEMVISVLKSIDPVLSSLPLIASVTKLIPTFVTRLEARLS